MFGLHADVSGFPFLPAMKMPTEPKARAERTKGAESCQQTLPTVREIFLLAKMWSKSTILKILGAGAIIIRDIDF